MDAAGTLELLQAAHVRPETLGVLRVCCGMRVHPVKSRGGVKCRVRTARKSVPLEDSEMPLLAHDDAPLPPAPLTLTTLADGGRYRTSAAAVAAAAQAMNEVVSQLGIAAAVQHARGKNFLGDPRWILQVHRLIELRGR